MIADAPKDASVIFRDGNKSIFCLTVNKGDEMLYCKPFYDDWYFLGFLKGLFYRNSCYSCKYAQEKRVGDFTIGDFWGYDSNRQPFPVNAMQGLSVILVNTEKGNAFLMECESRLIIQKRALQEAVGGNSQLRFPSKKHKKYQKFCTLYKKYGFEKAAKKVLWIYKVGYPVLFFVLKIWKRK